MRTKSFTPQIIGYQTELEKEYTMNLQAKINALDEFYQYVGKYVSVEDKNAFKGKFYETFIQRFSDKYAKDFPHLSLNKMFELVELNIGKVNALIDTINSIDLDVDADAPDFNIYTENEEQSKLHEYLTSIIQNINELSKTRNVYPAPLVQGMNGMLQFDFTTNKMIPSIPFIKGERQRF